MMRSVARNGGDGAVVHLDRNVESNDTGTRLNQVVNVLRDVRVLRCSLKEHLHLFEETRFTNVINQRLGWVDAELRAEVSRELAWKDELLGNSRSRNR